MNKARQKELVNTRDNIKDNTSNSILWVMQRTKIIVSISDGR